MFHLSRISVNMHRPLSSHPAVYLRAFRLPTGVYRKLTTAPPPSQGQSGTSQTPTRPEGSNTLIVLSALGALGGLYYYYTREQPVINREVARAKEEEAERKVREIGEAGKGKVESAAKQDQREYNEIKTTVEDAVTTARTRATEARTDLTDRARQRANEAQVKLDEIKNTAEQKVVDARDRSEQKIEKSKEVAQEAENKTRSWFSWGTRSK